MKFTIVDLKCTSGKRLVSWLHKRFVMFHKDFVKHDHTTKFNWKAAAEWKSSPATWTVVDCVQQQLDILKLLSRERGSAPDNLAPASGTIAVRQGMMLSVPMHPRSPVLYIQYCVPMSRALHEDRENEICRWHFFTRLSEVCVHAYPHSYSLFFILCEDSTLGWWWWGLGPRFGFSILSSKWTANQSSTRGMRQIWLQVRQLNRTF